jgi:hypothetical protein
MLSEYACPNPIQLGSEEFQNTYAGHPKETPW